MIFVSYFHFASMAAENGFCYKIFNKLSPMGVAVFSLLYALCINIWTPFKIEVKMFLSRRLNPIFCYIIIIIKSIVVSDM